MRATDASRRLRTASMKTARCSSKGNQLATEDTVMVSSGARSARADSLARAVRTRRSPRTSRSGSATTMLTPRGTGPQKGRGQKLSRRRRSPTHRGCSQQTLRPTTVEEPKVGKPKRARRLTLETCSRDLAVPIRASQTSKRTPRRQLPKRGKLRKQKRPE